MNFRRSFEENSPVDKKASMHMLSCQLYNAPLITARDSVQRRVVLRSHERRRGILNSETKSVCRHLRANLNSTVSYSSMPKSSAICLSRIDRETSTECSSRHVSDGIFILIGEITLNQFDLCGFILFWIQFRQIMYLESAGDIKLPRSREGERKAPIGWCQNIQLPYLRLGE